MVRCTDLRAQTTRLDGPSCTHTAGTMFELVQALNDGAEALKRRSSNPISLNAGCELFTAFVTLFPHDSAVSPPRLLHRRAL